MTKPTIRIHNSETNEIIDREMTNEEYVTYQEQQEQLDAIMQEKAKMDSDKKAVQAKLAALGLTAEDLKALGL